MCESRGRCDSTSPRKLSEAPFEYTLAVSMKLIPHANAVSMHSRACTSEIPPRRRRFSSCPDRLRRLAPRLTQAVDTAPKECHDSLMSYANINRRFHPPVARGVQKRDPHARPQPDGVPIFASRLQENQPLRAGVCYTSTTLVPHARSIDASGPPPEGWSGRSRRCILETESPTSRSGSSHHDDDERVPAGEVQQSSAITERVPGLILTGGASLTRLLRPLDQARLRLGPSTPLRTRGGESTALPI
jgi:hypothetical protein